MTESRPEDGVEAEGEKVGMREEKGRVLFFFCLRVIVTMIADDTQPPPPPSYTHTHTLSFLASPTYTLCGAAGGALHLAHLESYHP